MLRLSATVCLIVDSDELWRERPTFPCIGGFYLLVGQAVHRFIGKLPLPGSLAEGTLVAGLMIGCVRKVLCESLTPVS